MSNQYCDLEEECKLLNKIAVQYNKIVEQNKSLQTEIRTLKNILKEIAELTIIECSNCYVFDKECQYPKCENTKCNIYGILEKLNEVNNG